MSHAPTRLTPRSAGAVADLELLRAARTEVQPPVPDVQPTIAERLRSLFLRLTRGEAEAA